MNLNEKKEKLFHFNLVWKLAAKNKEVFNFQRSNEKCVGCKIEKALLQTCNAKNWENKEFKIKTSLVVSSIIYAKYRLFRIPETVVVCL